MDSSFIEVFKKVHNDSITSNLRPDRRYEASVSLKDVLDTYIKEVNKQVSRIHKASKEH